jgi:SAM-dependent methyltransferase
MDRICPICGSKNSKVLYQVTCDESARHFAVNRKSETFFRLREHLANLWGAKECSVVKCEDCDFGYASPYVGGDKKFYDLAYQRSSYPTWKFEFQETLDFLSNISVDREKFSVLEVGSGDGAFVSQLTGMVSSDSICATEYSDYGAEQIKKLGIEVYQSDFRENHKWIGKFAAVCMFQVLEHLDNLQAVFEGINRITKENAYLFLAVPNNKRINFNEANGALLDMPPNHIGRYTQKSFALIADRFGWEIKSNKVEQANSEKFLSQFSEYVYLRKTQSDNTLEHLIHSNRILQKLFMKQRINYLKKLHKEKILKHSEEIGGDTQWVAMQKRH